MKIHEYQAKDMLRKFGVAVPRGILATRSGSGTAEAKIAALRGAGVVVCDGPHRLGVTMKDLLSRRRVRAKGTAGHRTPGAISSKGKTALSARAAQRKRAARAEGP